MAKIIIELEIKGAARDALYVVDELLGHGVLQDAINKHELDAGPLHVESARAEPAPTPREALARTPNGAYRLRTPTGGRTLLRHDLGWSWADETPPAVRARLGV